jgi:hypothetical protein
MGCFAKVIAIERHDIFCQPIFSFLLLVSCFWFLYLLYRALLALLLPLLLQDKQKKKPEAREDRRRVRMARNELEEALCNQFKKQPHWHFMALQVRVTCQGLISW